MFADLSALSAQLKTARERMQAMPVTEIAVLLEQVARRWRDKTAPERRRAVTELSQWLPFSSPVCERALDALFEPLTAMRLIALLDDLLGTHHALDTFVPHPTGGRRKAFGAGAALLLLAGNVPGIGIWDIIFCLSCKTPVLVKPSSDEPLLASLFAQSLTAVAPPLADAVVILPLTETEIGSLLLDTVDTVIVYGTDETVTTVKRQVPAKVRVIERGHRVSVAIVAEEFADERAARSLALDIARFDQRGCLSPQVCFVMGQGGDLGRNFGEKVARALEQVNTELPTNLREGGRASMVQFCLTCEMLGATVLASDDANWAVAVWGEGQGVEDGWRKVTCPARVIHIVLKPSLSAVLDALRPLGKFLQGVAVAMDTKTAEQVAEAVGRLGASRVCPLGQLQVPPMEWSQDGKHLITELVRWCDFEPPTLLSNEGGWVEVFRGDAEGAALVRFALEQHGIPVSVEVDLEPLDPTRFYHCLRVPAPQAPDAQQVLANLNECVGQNFLSVEHGNKIGRCEKDGSGAASPC